MADSTQLDYKSLVPKYSFAHTLEEQEAQVAVNPLVQRFAKSRRELAVDPYRPAYHYVSPESTMNDPTAMQRAFGCWLAWACSSSTLTIT